MTTNFVLIDYENVQPSELGVLRGGPFKVKLFLGANQSKIPVALAAALHAANGKDPPRHSACPIQEGTIERSTFRIVCKPLRAGSCQGQWHQGYV
jgi:hypothetical protein